MARRFRFLNLFFHIWLILSGGGAAQHTRAKVAFDSPGADDADYLDEDLVDQTLGYAPDFSLGVGQSFADVSDSFWRNSEMNLRTLRGRGTDHSVQTMFELRGFLSSGTRLQRVVVDLQTASHKKFVSALEELSLKVINKTALEMPSGSAEKMRLSRHYLMSLNALGATLPA